MKTIEKILEFLLRWVKSKSNKGSTVENSVHVAEKVDLRKYKFKRAFEIAKKYSKQGITERETPLIIRNWWKQVGKPGYTEKTPWCTLAIYVPLIEAGLATKDMLPQKLQLARSVLSYPIRGFKQINAMDLQKGDIAIMWRGTRENGGGPRGWQGHVGWFDGWYEDSSYFYSIGGNQKDGFNRKRYKTSKLLGGIRVLSVEELQNFRNILV